MKITKKICKVKYAHKDEPVASFFPPEWGKITRAAAAISLDESGTHWCYTWCIYFTNNKVLPVQIVNGEPLYDFALVNTTTENYFNAAAYYTSLVRPRWIPVYAVKEASCITYVKEGGKMVEKVGYLQGSRMDPPWIPFTCKTDAFDFEISSDLFTVYFNGNLLGSWRHG